MSKLIIQGQPLPNMPWEDRAVDCKEVMWRCSANSIILRNLLPTFNSTFNSTVVPFKNGYVGVLRCDDTNRRVVSHVGSSDDGVKWNINEEPLRLECDNKEIGERVYGYDPCACSIDNRHYVTRCNGYHEPTIGVAYTFDFKIFHQLENALLSYNRNGVMLPRKINGNFVMLNRPSDTGHTPFGDTFYSESPDSVYWSKHHHVMSPAAFEVSTWQCMKIGAGPTPIKTSEGWLMFYHGVLRPCNGYVYSLGSALLGLEQSWKPIYRSDPYLISPQMQYEQTGDALNVRFPCAEVRDPSTGRVAVYYDCADTVTGLAFGYISEIIEFTKRTSII